MGLRLRLASLVAPSFLVVGCASSVRDVAEVPTTFGVYHAALPAEHRIGRISLREEDGAAVLGWPLRAVPGDIFRQERLERDMAAVVGRYRARGHAFADYTIHTSRAANAASEVDVDIVIRKGPVVTVRAIELVGLDPTLRTAAKINPGDRYSPGDIEATRAELARRSGETVALALRPVDGEPARADVTFLAVPTGKSALR